MQTPEGRYDEGLLGQIKANPAIVLREKLKSIQATKLDQAFDVGSQNNPL